MKGKKMIITLIILAIIMLLIIIFNKNIFKFNIKHY